MNNGQLIAYHNEIQSWKMNGSFLYELHKDKINGFYAKYRRTIQSVIEKMSKVNKKYCQMNKEGRLMLNEKGQTVLKPDADPQGYQDEMKSIFECNVLVLA